jgi:hypothetical protein
MRDGEADFLVCGPSTALSGLLLTLAKSRELRACRLPFERIAKDAQIDDNLSAGGVHIGWEFDGGNSRPVTSPHSVRGVFCYGDTPRHFRKDVVAEDIDYVQHELVAYFGFALSQFPNVINQPFCGSLTGYTETLPYQWNVVVNTEMGGVRVPDYDIATRMTPRDGIVYSTDFHSYTEWDSATLPRAHAMPGRPIYLRYERPAGDPCLIWFVDSVFIAIDPVTGDEASLNADERYRVNNLIDLFSGLFNLRLGQILVFRHGAPLHELTFGSVAPWLSFMQARPRLRSRFASALLDRLIDA